MRREDPLHAVFERLYTTVDQLTQAVETEAQARHKMMDRIEQVSGRLDRQAQAVPLWSNASKQEERQWVSFGVAGAILLVAVFVAYWRF